MDKRDDRIETEGEERAIEDRLCGFGGDPLPPVRTQQAPTDSTAAGFLPEAEVADSDKAGPAVPFDSPRCVRLRASLKNATAQLGPARNGVERSANIATNARVGVHRDDQLQIGERPRAETKPCCLDYGQYTGVPGSPSFDVLQEVQHVAGELPGVLQKREVADLRLQ